MLKLSGFEHTFYFATTKKWRMVKKMIKVKLISPHIMAVCCLGILWNKHRLDGFTQVLLCLLYCHMFVAFGRLYMNLSMDLIYPAIPIFIQLIEPRNNLSYNT